MHIRTQNCTLRKLHLPYLEAGPEQAQEAIVMIHGFPGSANHWRDLMPPLSQFQRVIALNMPGFGESDKPSQFDYDIDAYMPILQGLFEHLNINKVHLVLHDFGGAWGLTWAAQNLNRVASITLINTGLFLHKWHDLAKLFRTPIVGDIFTLLTPQPKIFNRMIRCGGANRLQSEALELLRNEMDFGTRRAMKRLYRNTDMPDDSHQNTAQIFARADVPTLIIWGKDDPYLPSNLAEKQLIAFPRAQLHLIDDCGHWPYLEKPAHTLALITQFFESLQAAKIQSSKA